MIPLLNFQDLRPPFPTGTGNPPLEKFTQTILKNESKSVFKKVKNDVLEWISRVWVAFIVTFDSFISANHAGE